jgi:hypothetical protein
MSVKEFATGLKQTIVKMKSEGVDELKTDNLIAYLTEVIESPNAEIAQVELERYRADLQLWVEQNKGIQASQMEMFKSVISSGQNALRTSFLMNGGATVALLAFLGKLSDHHQDKIPEFSSSLIIYVIGVLAITMASGSTYLSQWLYASQKQWQKITGFWLNMLAIVLGLASYGLFIWGTVRAYDAFINFT